MMLLLFLGRTNIMWHTSHLYMAKTTTIILDISFHNGMPMTKALHLQGPVS